MIHNIKSAGINQLVEPVLEYLSPILERGHINLFVSGGSSFELFQYVDFQLSETFKSRIHIFQVDERYGPVGHQDANANLFSNINVGHYASLNLILRGAGHKQTADDYAQLVDKALHSGLENCAILGVGTDQHIAGVKPMADAAAFQQLHGSSLVSAFTGADFPRVTITPGVIKQLDAIFVYANNHAKEAVFQSLQTPRPFNQSPAHVLTQAQQVTLLYRQAI